MPCIFTYSILYHAYRLIHDREIQLYDGTRLVRHDRYTHIQNESNLSDNELNNLGVYRIHPAFRIVGVAEPPQIGAAKGQWMTPEALSLFLYQSMRPLNHQETSDLVVQKVG